MGSWTKLEAGGILISFMALLVLFSLGSLGLLRVTSRHGTRMFLEVFRNVGVLVKEKVEELKALERVAEGGGLNEVEKERKRLLCRDLERSLLQEEISWRQKSRIKWFKEGDKYTKFIHQIANVNRRFNTIDTLFINGTLFKGRLWIALFPNLKTLLLKADKLWTQCSSPMNAWIVALSPGTLGCFVNWTLRRLMTMLIGTFCCIFIGDVSLGRNGVRRSSFASLRPRFRC